MFRAADSRSSWVASRLETVTPLLAAQESLRQAHGLLVAGFAPEPKPILTESLHRYFGRIVGAGPPSTLLNPSELAAVLAADYPEDYVFGGQLIPGIGVILVRGSRDTFVVPTETFEPSATGLKPDFGRFRITDNGQTLAFGDYEATLDSILYEHDGAYRHRAKARELEQDNSFGAALRRLRLLRGLKQSDFAPITEREIRRIERNEVGVPHSETQRIIAARLGVPFEEISTY